MPFFFALAVRSHPYGAGSHFPKLCVMLKKLSSEVRVSEKNKCAGLRRILVRMQGASASAY